MRINSTQLPAILVLKRGCLRTLYGGQSPAAAGTSSAVCHRRGDGRDGDFVGGYPSRHLHV